MLARMWTRGYDLYAPPCSVAWHQWSRSNRSTFHSCVPQVNISLPQAVVGALPALKISILDAEILVRV